MEKIFLDHPWIIVLIILWSFPWKAAALWRAARRGHIGWFLTLFILNTLAILDILYIFIFSGWGKETKQHEHEVEVAQQNIQNRKSLFIDQRKTLPPPQSRNSIV